VQSFLGEQNLVSILRDGRKEEKTAKVEEK